MGTKKLVGKAREINSFATGQLPAENNQLYDNVRPTGSFIASAFPLILSFF